MKTILFLHGFFASGSCVPAQALREAFEPMDLPELSCKVRLLTPDLPLQPNEALKVIREGKTFNRFTEVDEL